MLYRRHLGLATVVTPKMAIGFTVTYCICNVPNFLYSHVVTVMKIRFILLFFWVSYPMLLLWITTDFFPPQLPSVLNVQLNFRCVTEFLYIDEKFFLHLFVTNGTSSKFSSGQSLCVQNRILIDVKHIQFSIGWYLVNNTWFSHNTLLSHVPKI